jgi:hypothetical protein
MFLFQLCYHCLLLIFLYLWPGSPSPRSSDLSAYPIHGSPHIGRLKEILLHSRPNINCKLMPRRCAMLPYLADKALATISYRNFWFDFRSIIQSTYSLHVINNLSVIRINPGSIRKRSINSMSEQKYTDLTRRLSRCKQGLVKNYTDLMRRLSRCKHSLVKKYTDLTRRLSRCKQGLVKKYTDLMRRLSRCKQGLVKKYTDLMRRLSRCK